MVHLTTHMVSRLGSYQLAGDELLDALNHVETCDSCREKIPAVSESSVLERLDVSEEDRTGSVASSLSEGVFAPLLAAWKLRFAVATLAIFASALLGLFYWQMVGGGTEPGQLASLTTDDEGLDPDSAQITSKEEVTESLKENNPPEKRNLVETTRPSSSYRKTPKPNVNSVLARKARNRATKFNNVDSKRIPIVGNVTLNAEDRKSLEKFLVDTPEVLLEVQPVTTGVRGSTTVQKKRVFLTPAREVIRETKPIFMWESVPNSTKYKFHLMDENSDEVISKSSLVNRLETDESLNRGQLYQWKVVADTPDGQVSVPNLPNPPVIFRVATEKTIKELDDLEKQTGSEWKTVNVLLNKGMLSEGEAKLKAILKKTPKNKLATQLLVKVQNLKGKSSQRKSPIETKPAQ